MKKNKCAIVLYKEWYFIEKSKYDLLMKDYN